MTARGALRFDNVVKRYGGLKSGLLAVDGCTFDVDAGGICVVVGPSGCGKTTLLNAVAGFHEIDGGTITLDGEVLCGPGAHSDRRPGPHRRVPERRALPLEDEPGERRVRADRAAHDARRRRADKARGLMAEAGLAGHEDAYPGQTSSGVRRRVEIVRALMNDPAVLLLDEPFRALDSLTKSVMHETLLETYARNRVTIFFITHDLEEAIFLGTRVVVMTSRPARPKLVLDVDLPFPRRYDVVTSEGFRRLLKQATEVVHDEARKAFELGEREGRA